MAAGGWSIRKAGSSGRTASIASTLGWSTTPITDRQQWFAGLPAKDSPLGKFYGRGNWAPHNYYEGKSYEIYNFTAANLQRKYGDDWSRQFHDLLPRRLRSWGMNTIGNWSDASIYRMRKTPYVVTIHSGGRILEGSQGYWGKFADVFDPRFAESIRADAARHQAPSAEDPWCLGYFVDNELSWGDELSLAEAALASPADQPAKRALLADLRAKYSHDRAAQRGLGHATCLLGSLAGKPHCAQPEKGPRRPGGLRHQDGRAVLPHLPRRGQAVGPARPFTWAAASLGSTIAPCGRPGSSAT